MSHSPWRTVRFAFQYGFSRHWSAESLACLFRRWIHSFHKGFSQPKRPVGNENRILTDTDQSGALWSLRVSKKKGYCYESYGIPALSLQTIHTVSHGLELNSSATKVQHPMTRVIHHRVQTTGFVKWRENGLNNMILSKKKISLNQP